MRPRDSAISSALASVAALVLLIGCAEAADGDDLTTRQPAAAAVAPTLSAAPGGQVLPVATQIGALVAEPATGLLAALEVSGATLSLLDPAAEPPAVRIIALSAHATALAPGRAGEILLAAPGRVIRVDAAVGSTSEVLVDGDVRSVALRGDGTLLAGTAEGKVRALASDGAVLHTISGLASADGLAIAGGIAAVLDRRQSSITELDPVQDRLGLALRAGEGATGILADRFGRIIVTDTAGAELLVYTTGPLVLHQRFPVNSSPYALTYDQRSDTVWVTCTQSNEVVGFDLSRGIPENVGRYPTVRQPNSVTIDERTGDLFVGSATGDGLQRIRADQRKRGQ